MQQARIEAPSLQKAAACRTMFLDRRRPHRPLQRHKLNKREQPSERWYCSTTKNGARGKREYLDMCLRVTAKDLCQNKGVVDKKTSGSLTAKLPSEVANPNKIVLLSSTCKDADVSDGKHIQKTTEPSRCTKSTKPLTKEASQEKETKPSRTCPIIRASSRGLLKVNSEDNAKAVETSYASKYDKLTMLRGLSGENGRNTTGQVRFPVTATKKSFNKSHGGNKTLCFHSSMASDSDKNNAKESIKTVLDSVPETRALPRQDKSRSKSSTGYHAVSKALQSVRHTKSAGAHRPTGGVEELDGKLDPLTVARLADRLELHVVENNLQKFIALLTPLSPQARAQITNFRSDVSTTSSSFFRACQLSRLGMVEWTLRDGLAELELTGLFLQPGEMPFSQVTPLWYASATGNLPLVRLLTSHGADVNAVSDTGCTVVRAACCTGQTPLVQFLVAHGSHTNTATPDGVTCLMSSVHSLELVKFLAHHGVSVNAVDVQGNSALHYAIDVGQSEVTRYLIETGAKTNIVNKSGRSPLQLAAENMDNDLTEYIIEATAPGLQDIADAYSMLGAMTIAVAADVRSGLRFWQKALSLNTFDKGSAAAVTGLLCPWHPSPGSTAKVIPSCGRHTPSNLQRRRMSVLARELDIVEITSVEELAQIASNYDALCMQALLVFERIRGSYHDTLASLLMYRGEVCHHRNDYSKAALLWSVAYDLQLSMCSEEAIDPLHPRLCRNVKLLLKVFCKASRCKDYCDLNETRLCKTFGMLVGHIMRTLPTRSAQHEETIESLLQALILLFQLYLRIVPVQQRSREFWQHLRRIIQLNPKSSNSKPLLSLCVNRQCNILSDGSLYNAEDPYTNCKPMLEIMLLLGADPLVRDADGNSVLHVAAQACNTCSISSDTVLMLLDKGAHADQVNKAGQFPVDLLPEAEVPINMLLRNKVSLQCLSARAIVRHNIPFRDEIPRALYKFVELHAA